MHKGLRNIRVLLVDDHHFMRSVWRALLDGLGFREIVDCRDSEAAFTHLRQGKFDLIVTDYHLGDVNGAEFARMLRAQEDPACHLVPIIGCTADTRRAVISDMIDSGMDEVLAKPVSARIAWSKFHAIAERRRPFVRTNVFFGPDRRRLKGGSFAGEERRDLLDLNDSN
ncbi:MAG: response regulator [Hyphomonadaceae bacterium]